MSRHTARATLIAIALVAAELALGSLSPAGASPEPTRTMYNEGTGQALIYPLWQADGHTDTLFEIVNRVTDIAPEAGGDPSGASPPPRRHGRWVLVNITIRDEKDSVDVRDFHICLSPGDVWRAILTLKGGVVHLLSSDDSNNSPGSTLGPPPVDTVLVPNPSLGVTNPTRGYIEAVMFDNGLSEVTGCDGVHGDDYEPSGDLNGMDNPLFGRATYVNIGTGLIAGVNAEAIHRLDPNGDREQALMFPSVKGFFGAAGSGAAFRALALGDSKRSVRGSLLGPWRRGPKKFVDTQVVLTFPTGKNHQFKFCDDDIDFNQGNAFQGFPFGQTDCDPAGSTGGLTILPLDFRILPINNIALWIRNDTECVNQFPRQIFIPHEVNVITFSELPDTMFNVLGFPHCRGFPGTRATEGWFRLLFDDNEDEVRDAVVGTGGAVPPTVDLIVRVPRVIAAVGFVIITDGQVGKSAIYPFQSESPYAFYDCGSVIESGFGCFHNND